MSKLAKSDWLRLQNMIRVKHAHCLMERKTLNLRQSCFLWGGQRVSRLWVEGIKKGEERFMCSVVFETSLQNWPPDSEILHIVLLENMDSKF